MIAAGMVRQLRFLGSPEKAKALSGFFTCGKGEHGEESRLLGKGRIRV